MNREIKFRAWDSHEKHMYTVTELSFMKYDSKPIRNGCEGFWGDNHRKKFALDELNIMQYTGLKDKNGKEIYEGDICKGNWPYAVYCIVKWIDGRGGFMMVPRPGDGIGGGAAYDSKGYKLNACKVEIIGNIYENPELLK